MVSKNQRKFSNKSGLKHTELGSVHPSAPVKEVKAIEKVNRPKNAPGASDAGR